MLGKSNGDLPYDGNLGRPPLRTSIISKIGTLFEKPIVTGALKYNSKITGFDGGRSHSKPGLDNDVQHKKVNGQRPSP